MTKLRIKRKAVRRAKKPGKVGVETIYIDTLQFFDIDLPSQDGSRTGHWVDVPTVVVEGE